MVQHRPSKEEVLTAFRRAAILESAQQVFGGSGFERATIDRIARDAGVAKGTGYLYYTSKQSIYEDALNHGFAELDEVVRVRLDAATSLRDAISGFIRTRVGYFLERRAFFRMYVAAVAAQLTDTAACPAGFKSLNERQTKRLQAVVARAVAAGEIRQVDPATIAVAILDLTRGLVARRLVATAESDLEAEIETLMALIWQGLGTRARPAATGRPRKRPARRPTARKASR